MSAPKVTSLLRSNICKSEATAVYLDLMREVVEAFTRPDLEPLIRIEMIWKWVFFLRIWRSWLEKNKEDYSIKNNFISSNAYACIEINAHSLIQIIIKLRDAEEHKLFLPWVMSSQACESKFRRLRATSENFSISDLENNFARLDLLTTTYVKLSEVIHFPRHHKASKISDATAHIPISLPENYEIEMAVKRGLEEAICIAKQFNLLSRPPPGFIPRTYLKEVSMTQKESDLADVEDEEIDSGVISAESDDEDDDASALQDEDQQDDESDVTEDLFIVSSGAIGVKKFSDVPLTKDSPFVLVGDGFGNPAIIRKSSLVWFLGSGDTKLSSDRLVRVQQRSSHSVRKQMNLLRPTREETVYIGDWCAFVEDGKVVVGRVLAFRYLSGTTLKNQEYKHLSAPVDPPEKNARGLGCMCSWFSCKGNSRALQPMSMDSHGYYSIEHYICSLPRPVLKNDQLLLTCTLRSIAEFKK